MKMLITIVTKSPSPQSSVPYANNNTNSNNRINKKKKTKYLWQMYNVRASSSEPGGDVTNRINEFPVDLNIWIRLLEMTVKIVNTTKKLRCVYIYDVILTKVNEINGL